MIVLSKSVTSSPVDASLWIKTGTSTRGLARCRGPVGAVCRDMSGGT